MAATKSAYQGCLLGLAAGDAMGYPVDRKSWREIRSDYGPNGLMGYDLTGGCAEVTSHTQLCAFTCNGLLLGLTRERLQARTAPYVRYIALSQKEWVSTQRRWSTLQRTYCWVYWAEALRRRHCADSRMLDTLSREHIGTPADPVNSLDGPDSLTAAVAAGMFAQAEPARLGAEAVALTYGDPTAFITGAVTASLVSRLLRQDGTSVLRIIEQSLKEAGAAYNRDHPQTVDVICIVCRAVALAKSDKSRQCAMEELGCVSAPQVLAGAVYALLTCGDDFDAAMITAVNHSGRSGAVAALTGALLGAKLGLEGIPDFYLEGLEAAADLKELAADLYSGCPASMDLEWESKYLRGER